MEENGNRVYIPGGDARKHMSYTVPTCHLHGLSSNGVFHSALREHSYAVGVSLMCQFGGHA